MSEGSFWMRFMVGRLAIHTETQEEYTEFLERCEAKDIKSYYGEPATNFMVYPHLRDETCINFDEVRKELGFWSEECYLLNGYAVVKYSDIFRSQQDINVSIDNNTEKSKQEEIKMKYKVGDRVNTCFGVGTVVFVKETGCPYLIKHDNWGGGHNGVRGLEGIDKLKLQGDHCYWFKENEITKVANHKVIITTDGVNVIARLKEDGNELKKTIAKCNPQDTFDFETGAKLAFERLFKKEVKEVKRQAKVGERIKIINAMYTSSKYKDGDIFQVDKAIRERDNVLEHVRVKEHVIPILASEYVVLENYEPSTEEPKLYNTKIVCVKTAGDFTEGKIYEVKDGFLFNDKGKKFGKGLINGDQYKNIKEINNDLTSSFIEVVE